MILTGQQIKWAKEQGYLDISDWDDKRLNPNSYNLRLADELMVYGGFLTPKDTPKSETDLPLEGVQAISLFEQNKPGWKFIRANCIDMKLHGATTLFKIPEVGFLLEPGILYLARTMEYTETHKFVPMLEGRSSVGRLGIQIHSTAGFGDIGFCGYWTLEISVVQPVIIYAGIDICQIYYHTVPFLRRDGNDTSKDGVHYGDIWIPNDDAVMKYDSGKYQKNNGIQPSMMWKEFKEEK